MQLEKDKINKRKVWYWQDIFPVKDETDSFLLTFSFPYIRDWLKENPF